MAILLAPYNPAMQLGTGFNSFTQQLCISDAVVSNDSLPSIAREMKSNEQNVDAIAQNVSYKACVIDKVSDFTSEMNINAAFAIQCGIFDVEGNAEYLNTSKFKGSDVFFLFSVKVVKQVVSHNSLTEIVPIKDHRTSQDVKAFTNIYGDCFISGFQEGGIFIAVISVTAKSEEMKRDIKEKADVFFTKSKSEEARQRYGEDNNKVDFHFALDNLKDTFLRENETTLSVSCIGGGPEIKNPEENWTFENMKTAALKFPALVAKTPMRTHAILTKYTSLRSYHQLFSGITPPSFEVADAYSRLLQEAYLDYKIVAKNLQALASDVVAGRTKLLTASEHRQLIEKRKGETGRKATEEEFAGGNDESNPNMDTPTSEELETKEQVPKSKPQHTPDQDTRQWKPINITKEYRPTVQGLLEARSMVRSFQMRIVQELDMLSSNPELALDDQRIQPYMSPFLFKGLIPVGQPITEEDEE